MSSKTRDSLVAFVASSALSLSAAVSAQSPGWENELILYGWFPDIDGTLNFEVPDSGDSVGVEASELIDSLEAVFMGAYEGRGENWSLKLDLLYLDLENSESQEVMLPTGTLSNIGVKQGMTGTQLGVYGGYNVVNDGGWVVDLMGGIRYFDLDVDAQLSITGKLPPTLPSPNLTGGETLLDGVVGIKGQYEITENWYLPFHFDVGSGDSSLTWQALAGVGYRYNWGSLLLVYRNLSYDQGSSGLIQDLEFAGPAAAVSFSF
jgi:hypothetical protein